jgi:tetratricopeptide (TPR) repeat protein
MRPIFYGSLMAFWMLQACSQISSCSSNDPDDSISGCTAVIAHETNPSNLALYYENRALAYEHKGLFDLAAADYAKAVSLQPNFTTHYNRAEFYSDSGRYDQAVPDYDAAISNYEKSSNSERTLGGASEADYVNAYEHRGLAYGQQNLEENAISDFSKVIALKPDLYKSYNNRGLAYSSVGKYGLAVLDFTEVIAHKPDFDAYYNRGLAYEGEGLHDQAIADFTESISREHDFAEGYYARGRSYEKKGLPKEALQDYHKALASDSKLLVAIEAIKRLGETP